MKRSLSSRMSRALSVLVITALLAASCVGSAAGVPMERPAAARPAFAAPTYTATIADARSAANALLSQTGAASMSVALVDGDRIVWRGGFGYANVATQAKPQASTMYGIGSVSKMFATVATMKLVDQGLVHWTLR